MTQNIMQMKPYPLGAHTEGELVRFSFVSAKEDCGIVLYDIKSGRKVKKIPFTVEERIGNVYCKYLNNIDVSEVSYQFYEGDRLIPCEQAERFVGKAFGKKEGNVSGCLSYGKGCSEKEYRAAFITEAFDWRNDKKPRIPYGESICYCAHVRGFTKHASSGVTHRGTFKGMMEKIPYLKEIGVTTIELQPAYEFFELPSEEERLKSFPRGTVVSKEDMDVFCPKRLNYWGYKKGYYYAPKTAYAAGADATVEFKEMVRCFHENDMEVVMQFYFPDEVAASEIPGILRHWVINYHVDGFHLMGLHLPMEMIVTDPLLSDTKIWYYDFDENIVAKKKINADEKNTGKNLAGYRDDFRYIMRRYLKGDENMLRDVLYQMRYNPENMGNIHYMTNYDGMTLMDLVSYDQKHNEANGEENRDGNPHNFSWNCGEEGPSRKKKVVSLRKQQIKNAMAMLLFSQSTPLIFMGDEFGNSQKGNNNPYCQDNNVTWLDWKDMERNCEIFEFWKGLVALRKKHPILHKESEFTMMDALSCGYPDLSYHGQNAWRAQTEGYNRHVGIMLCGKYAKNEEKEDSFLYIGMNMYWQPQKLALPDLPKGMGWKCVLSTAWGAGAPKEEIQESREGSVSENMYENISAKIEIIPARTICLYEGIYTKAEKKIPQNKEDKTKKVKANKDE